jgi:guanylate kinase
VQCRISPSKTIGGLSQRQRTELVTHAAPLAAARVASVSSSPAPRGRQGTLIRTLLRACPQLELRSATTPPRRGRGSDGVDYHFLTTEFERARCGGDFVEHAALLRPALRHAARRARAAHAARHPVLLEIEARARASPRDDARAVQMFIAPDERRCARARRRGTGHAEQVGAPRTAREELAAQHEFSHVVVNDRLEDAVAELEALVRGKLD